MRTGRGLVRVLRTTSGPRLFVVGRRIHEYHVGLATLGLLAAGEAVGRSEFTALDLLPLLVGTWLVVKDWRDLFPSLRDTSTWTLGIHRRSVPLRPFRATDSVPRVTAIATAFLGVVNLVSTLTPNVRFRGELLEQIEPAQAIGLMHALAVPASLTLLTVAYYLDRRRRSAWWMALVLLTALAVLDLAKGLDVEEAILSACGVGLLWWGRAEFSAGPDAPRARAATRRAATLGLGAVTAAVVSVRIAAPDATWAEVVRQVTAAAAWHAGPITFYDELGHLQTALSASLELTLLACLFLVLRPFADPVLHPGAAVVEAVESIVRTHGTGTLDYFKLRKDLHHVFDDAQQALVSFRVESGVVLCAGDPIGPADAQEQAVGEAVRFAQRQGLRLGAVGVSERSSEIFARAGLRRLYLGDEALVDTAAFSLEGRAIRKVRQAVTRVERKQFSFELVGPSTLGEADRDAVREVSTLWLDGRRERGFAMSLDALLEPHLADTLFALARDGRGHIRAFLQLVPSRGGRTFSLSAMRRDPRTPNGLTEFLVARSIEALRRRGVEEVSLNFAVLARWMQAPSSLAERWLGRLARVGNAHFQLESLFRFNSKFAPRWEPRYLVFESWQALPRTAFAAARAEGQMPPAARISAHAAPVR